MSATAERMQRVAVEWDSGTDYGHAPASDLPPSVVPVPWAIVWGELDGTKPEGTVADWLSDEHGWCIDGWEAVDDEAPIVDVNAVRVSVPYLRAQREWLLTLRVPIDEGSFEREGLVELCDALLDKAEGHR